MSAKISLAVSATVVLIAGIFCASSAGAQGASASSLADQLKAQYKLAKIVPESNGYKVAEPGTILVIQKDGIFGVPLGNNSVDPVIYAIQKDAKHEKVSFTIVECDSSEPVKPSYYKSIVDFEFPNGYLAAAEVGQIEDVISQILTIDNGTNDAQQQVHGGQSSPGGLTSDDIIKLAQAKLPESVVIAKIKSSSSEFDTSPDALIKLKRAGVSDTVLQAIVDAKSNPSDSGENSQAAASSKESDTAQTTTFSGLYDSLFSQAQLQFNSDGSFSQHGPGSWQNSGRFTVNGDTLTMTYPSTGRSSIFRIQGDKIYSGTGKPVWARQEDPSAAAPAQTTFPVRHRHISLAGPGPDAIYYCSGELSVSADGTVRYDCTQTDDPSGRCEHVSFSAGSLKQAKIGHGGTLHLASKAQGNADFSGDPSTLQQALAAIAPLVSEPRHM
jgi:hypothetical protein